jgi:RNA polymerase-associated protein
MTLSSNKRTVTTSSNKRTVTTLFSDPLCPLCHRTRIVLAEKNISVDIIDIDPDNLPEDLVQLNPYNSVPTLVDRDLTLYESKVIMEYFDERFPHPPLMPVDPISRARIRLMLYRVDQEWYRLLGNVPRSNITPLLDCALAPLLWRLPALGIELPPQAKLVEEYATRIFSRDSFQRSLSNAEREIRLEATGFI